MREAAGALGCARLVPTPHGLRHGGASHDRAHGTRTLLEIQARGKWRSFSSVVRYEKHARISQQFEALDLGVLAGLRWRAGRLPSACAASCEKLWAVPAGAR